LKPALIAAVWPKFRRKRMMRRCGIFFDISTIFAHDVSVLPSSTRMISQERFSPESASNSFVHKSSTFSSSL